METIEAIVGILLLLIGLPILIILLALYLRYIYDAVYRLEDRIKDFIAIHGRKDVVDDDTK